MAHQVQQFDKVGGDDRFIDAVGKAVHLANCLETALDLFQDAFGAVFQKTGIDRRPRGCHFRKVAEQSSRFGDDRHDVFQLMGNRGIDPTKKCQAVIAE